MWDDFSDPNVSKPELIVNYNDKGVPRNLSGSLTAMQAAMNSWTSVSSSSFVFTYGADTGRCPSLVNECRRPQKFDGSNDVGWLNIREAGVLGVTWYGTVTDEFDMVLDNRNYTRHIGPEGAIPASSFDAETVWLHEFVMAPGPGLGHTDVTGAVMYPSIASGKTIRSIHRDDIVGVTILYPDGAVSEPTATPTATPPPGGEATSVEVASITHAGEGGKNGDKHLRSTVALADDLGDPVSIASVSIAVTNDNGGPWTGTGTTGADGTVTFTLKNAPSGCYSLDVTNVVAAGLVFDDTDPANEFCK